MTKYYTISYPGNMGQHIQETLSEDQILQIYYEYWSNRMKKVGKEYKISEYNCILDWASVHWATESDKFGNPL